MSNQGAATAAQRTTTDNADNPHRISRAEQLIPGVRVIVLQISLHKSQIASLAHGKSLNEGK